MEHIDWKDVGVRAVKTFLETSVTAFLAGMHGVDLFAAGKGFWAALVLSAGAAGVSAVWNGMVEPMVRRLLGKAQ